MNPCISTDFCQKTDEEFNIYGATPLDSHRFLLERGSHLSHKESFSFIKEFIPDRVNQVALELISTCHCQKDQETGQWGHEDGRHLTVIEVIDLSQYFEEKVIGFTLPFINPKKSEVKSFRILVDIVPKNQIDKVYTP